jgi:sec-independent protein translocase protein TatB
MFDLSLEKLFILAIVALLILGPERLPTAAAWLARTLRQIRDFASDANQRLRSELGPEFDELRPTLQDLRQDLAGLRTVRDPRTALLHHLSDEPAGVPRYPAIPENGRSLRPLSNGERPPIDPDAT